MATGFDHLMNTTPLSAVGKGRVGAPPPPPAGKTGVTVRVAIFFDGTKNNRSNTTKRLRDRNILQVDGHDGGSSYGNFYSNPAIHEFMNNRNDPAKHEVSHYVEGIGTRDFVDGATEKEMVEMTTKDKDGKITKRYEEREKKDKNGRPIPIEDKDNGQDDIYGNGFGAGPTGIREKVDSGIRKLKAKIVKARGDIKKFYIEKIVFDVFGFSRGAAAARHFIHRRDALRTWPGQRGAAELVINFVGLYDTVSSFARQYGDLASVVGGVYVDSTNTDTIFCDDVKELGLNLGAVPKKVVHLTAADEHRQNFSLTNINTSLKAGVGLELALPGVHSDVGGSYTEAGQGARNLEVRRIRDGAEKRRLIAEGWYTDGRPGPDGRPTPNQFVLVRPSHFVDSHTVSVFGHTFHTPASGSDAPIGVNGVRSLTNEYQYVPLALMHELATAGGRHEALDLASFADRRFAAYRVPSPLAGLSQHFIARARALDGARTRQAVTCRSVAETHWLRNRYLHRSAKQDGDEETIGMEPRADTTADGHLSTARLVIPDDDPHFVPPSLRPRPQRAAW